MFESLVSSVESIVSTFGAPGIFLAMFIETIFPPIPSELVMPLGGYVAYIGGGGPLALVQMILAGSLGSTLGATMIYYIALSGGRKAILRYGRRFFIDDRKLKVAESWFERHGAHAVFLCRMAPGLREIISIPAGLARMEIRRFLVYTFAGSLVWSTFLGSIGYFLADVWQNFNIEKVFGPIGIILVTCVVVFLVFLHFMRNGKKKRN